MDGYDESEPDLGESVEVQPGVVVERRSFIGLCSVAFLAPRSSRIAIPTANEEPRLTLEEFLEEVLPVARDLRAELAAKPERSAEDQYLFTLASFAARIGDVAVPELRATSQGEGVGIGASWIGDPFVVLHWRMEPNARIRLHAHTYGNVCTLGLEGTARVQNYETVGAFDVNTDGLVRVRRTNDQRLDPHAINLVPLSHGFCHGFEAGPEGARGLDITTRLAERQPTPYLEVDETPIDAAAGIYGARWSVE